MWVTWQTSDLNSQQPGLRLRWNPHWLLLETSLAAASACVLPSLGCEASLCFQKTHQATCLIRQSSDLPGQDRKSWSSEHTFAHRAHNLF